MLNLESFYRGKRVLVTGHTGFKGSWLTAWLKLMGAQVTGFSLEPDAGQRRFFDPARIADGITSAIGDIRDRDALRRVIQDQQPEIVFHLAAQTLVRPSYRDPIETFSTNVMGTANVLEELRASQSVRSIVVITTDKCYENREWDWGYRENDPLGGHDPYSASKACAEIVTAAYRSSFFNVARERVGVASARAGNVIGGGDWSTDRIVPDIVRALSQGIPVLLRNPAAVRPWQHVLEPVRGYLMLGQRLWYDADNFASAWNFGPRTEDAIPVVDLTEQFIATWGSGSIEVVEQLNAPHEARLLKLDISKAERALRWQPIFRLEDAVRTTANWYRTVVDNDATAQEITNSQIIAFRDLAWFASQPRRHRVAVQGVPLTAVATDGR